MPASSARNCCKMPCARSVPGMFLTPGSFPGEGGLSPRFEGASKIAKRRGAGLPIVRESHIRTWKRPQLIWEGESRAYMFVSRPIGFVSSPYRDTTEIPKGLHAKHEAEGALKVLPEFEAGLTDIEGFSHLFVIWEFDKSQDFDLIGRPPADDRPHGVFATRSPRR